jgi:hypothetical protein
MLGIDMKFGGRTACIYKVDSGSSKCGICWQYGKFVIEDLFDNATQSYQPLRRSYDSEWVF